MNGYEFLLPMISLAIGVLLLLIFSVITEPPAELVRGTHRIVLLLALAQQILLYRDVPMSVGRGGMVIDHLSQLFSLAVLGLAFFMHVNRTDEEFETGHRQDSLWLAITLAALFAVQSQRLFFGIVGVVVLILFSQWAVALENHPDDQASLIHKGLTRDFIILVVGLLMVEVAFVTFGETGFGDWPRVLSRPHVNEAGLITLQALTLFVGGVLAGFPPFSSVLGQAHSRSSWNTALGCLGMLALVGLNVFLRWGILSFSRVAIGGGELESVAGADIFLLVRVIAVAGLVLCPLFALIQKDIREGLVYMLLNPFVQILYAASLQQKELMSLSLGTIVSSVLGLVLVMVGTRILDIPRSATLADWVGCGRRAPLPTLIVILTLVGLAGFPPAFNGFLIQKTLCINAATTFLLLINLLFSGIYVARLTSLAFLRRAEETLMFPAPRRQIGLFSLQFVCFILLGIFWQPLYKYGAYSIKIFFGES